MVENIIKKNDDNVRKNTEILSENKEKTRLPKENLMEEDFKRIDLQMEDAIA